MLKPGTILDQQYELLELIGEGGFGAVWKASEIHLHRVVAIKTLLGLSVTDERSRKRFKREGRALAALSHPHLTKCFRFGLTPQQHLYIAMEFVEGRSLRQILEHETLSMTRILAIASQTCEGLHAAHAHGIIHRDLSPNNIMLLNNQSGDFVKVIDFGLSRIISADISEENTLDQRLTHTGGCVGSPNYLSPERFSGEEGDARADVYGLGCIVYEMVAGRPVFEGDSYVALMRKHTEEKPQPLSKTAPKEQVIPAGLEDILQRALAKNVCDRYQTMRDFQDDLKLVAEGKGHLIARVTPVSTQTQKKQLLTKGQAALMALITVACTIGAGMWWRQRTTSETTKLTESLHDTSSATRRLKTPGEIESLAPKARIEYYSNWLQSFGNTSSVSLARALSVAQARYRLALDLQPVDSVEARMQGEQAMREYQEAFDDATEASKGMEADIAVVGIVNCAILLSKTDELKTLLPQLIEQIESKGEVGLGVALATCRRELGQYYIGKNDYKSALTSLDSALSGRNKASISTTEFINLSVRRARCLRLLGLKEEAKAALGDCLRAETKLAPNSGIAQRTAIIEEAVSQHLPDRDLVPLCLNALNAFRDSGLPIGNSWSIYQTYADGMISLRQHKEAFDVLADGMPRCPPLAQFQVWQLMCKLNRDGKLNRDEQLRKEMLALINRMKPDSPAAMVHQGISSIVTSAHSYMVDKQDKSAFKILQLVRPVFAKYDGPPESGVYFPLVQAAVQCIQLQQEEEANSILRSAMTKIGTRTEAGTGRICSLLAEHMVLVIRKETDPTKKLARYRELLAKLNENTLRASKTSVETDQAAIHLARCRIYQALHQLSDARTEALRAIEIAHKVGNRFQEGDATLELALMAQAQNNPEAESYFVKASQLFPKDRLDWRLRFYVSHAQFYIQQKNVPQLRTAMISSLQDLKDTTPGLYNTMLKSYLTTCIKYGLSDLRIELEQQFKPIAAEKV